MSRDGSGHPNGFPFPRRIFLDTGVVQYFFDYGEFIFDGGSIEATDRIRGVPDGVRDLDALKLLHRVNQRNGFELAVSENSIKEVERRRRSHFTSWAFELASYWSETLATYDSDPFGERGNALAESLMGSQFGFLSEADRALLQDACQFECGCFLTVDRRLVRNAPQLARHLGIRVATPTALAALIEPWAALF